MGCPTVVLNGPAGNRLLFQNDFNIIANKQPISLTRIVGKKSILELSGEDHKRMRSAIMQFLKPEALQKFVGRMNSIIKKHFVDCWDERTLAGDLLFGLNDSEEIEILSQDFTEAFKALWSLPLDLPGTAFRSELKARSRICKRLSSLLKVRRRELHEGKFCPGQDLMSNMLSSRNENGKAMTEEEIIDNMIALMSAGHETTCNLLINVLRLLALNPHVYQKVLEEHMEILTKKEIDEPLTWDDIQKMKYTWKVCQETMRLISPVFGGFRKAMKDVEFGGFVIPKGWQILNLYAKILIDYLVDEKEKTFGTAKQKESEVKIDFGKNKREGQIKKVG
ncbi:taxadiene 5-alpha hydroxylase-like [Cryptomeria japonica]|uniref:taxadiene 5-alpha hydroxylase-like n=1 Tax=Cryptomeria japonica TaxID=3369 RepID=UPI0027DA4830|nr:taxadiene 5-alpha hydroxylase-like [Cryptomeria japonica]